MAKKKSPVSNLRILVTNDDGIHAPGLAVLERIARSLSNDVWVVAPEVEQSGASHSLTLHTPLRVRQIEAQRFAVSGTPTDCVLLGAREIVPRKKRVQLVLSGVNRGSNIAEDITYSGTVAAAMEAALLDIPSIALSQAFRDDSGKVRWETAEQHAAPLIRRLLKVGWKAGTLLNINFPDRAPSQTKDAVLCPQGKRAIGDKITKRIDPRGRPYYWIGGIQPEGIDCLPGSDEEHLLGGHITVTPIALDLTDFKELEVMRGHFEGKTRVRTPTRAF